MNLRRLKIISGTLFFFLVLILSPLAFADSQSDPLDQIKEKIPSVVDYSNPERDVSGESQINSIVLEVSNFIRNLLATLAILWIVAGAVKMALAGGDEAVVKEQGKGILYALAGLAIALLADRVVALIFGTPGATRTDLLTSLPTGIGEEVAGVISYIKALIGAVAVFMIILSGVRLLVTTEEDKRTKIYGSLLWVAVGLIVIIINGAVVNFLYINPVERGLSALSPDANVAGSIPIAQNKLGLADVSPTIKLIATVIQFGLGFVGLIAFALLVYAGATMALNFGNEEAITNARKIAVSALIGIVMILSAYAIVSTVIL